MSLLIFYFSLAVIVSFLCSLMESVILSTSYTHIETISQKGVRYAPLLKQMKYQISKPLSAILTINTIANTLGAAGVGAQVHKLYGSSFVTIFSIGLTFVILIFSEIIPKTLGASYWKTFLPVSVYIIQGLVFICYPFVQLSRLVQKLFRVRTRYITREDIIGAAQMGINEGAIYKNEGELVQNILNLKSKKVSEIMTPRTVITALNKKMSIKEVLDKYQPLRFSRIPVYEGDLDHIVGIVHRYKILEDRSKESCDKLTVENYLRPVHTIPENISITAALDQFIKRKEHIFLVVDEYGSLSGLVSMEDVVETILGIEIVDELDSVPDLRAQALKQWKQKKNRIRKVK
ncbi:MAG: hemolysin family protein [Bdellovibrionaceae bacterium]|nr:hemolysin family protein [Pseudobdellovibrionaceae bacterium]